ncbi:Retrotransposon gag domain [Sesbania bispinosa]|nr:Retrotransposon gag domain [Sesbania bispinosa]
MAAQPKDPSQDPNNPLFLHHSDGPGLVLTSQPLDHKNYTTWSRAMTVALSVKNKLPLIDGSLPKPAATHPTFVAWSRANNVVISWLYNSLRRQLMSLQQGSDDVSTYYTKLKSIWEELSGFKPTFNCTCGGLQHLQTHTESEYVMSFLMGLHDSFSHIRGQILLSDPLPPIGNVFSLVLQDEAQREIVALPSPSTASSDNIAFSVNSSTKFQSDISKTKSFKKARPKCSHCDMLGHTKDKCYKLVGYPPNYFKNKTPNVVNQVADSPDSSTSTPSFNLTPAQCQQLITFLSNQMTTDTNMDAVATNVIGPQNIEDDWHC